MDYTEEQIRQICREEVSRLMTTLQVGAGEPAEEKVKPVTQESLFTDIVTDVTVRNWSEIVVAAEQQGLTNDLIESDQKIDHDAYKQLNYKFKAMNAGDMTRLGLEAPRAFSTIGVCIKETATDIEVARAGKLAEEAQAAKPLQETQNGMTRKEVFAEEAERRATYQDNSLPPLEHNRWAYRQ